MDNKVICDHTNDCLSITCGHKKVHEFHSEICEIDHDGKPIVCKNINKVVKCVADPIGQRLEIAERVIELLRGLERRTVCPMCFHLRKAGHSRKCKIMKELDAWEGLTS